MTISRSILGVVALCGLAQLASAVDARADEPTYSIAANVNDPAITAARGPNLVWLAPASRRVNKLLVFLPSGGANNFPTEFKWVGTEGGRLGYHTIVLAYRNEVGINATPPLGCGAGIDPPATPPNCARDVHMELLDGGGESPVIDVDRANSIENRLTKALQYLAATHPDEGWAQFLDTSGAAPAPKWAEAMIAGQSLGAGEAFWIGQVRSVFRVAAFSGWTDAKHGWVTPGLTSTSRYFAQIHMRENFYERTCFAYLAIGLAGSCPLTPELIDDRQPPFGSRQLVFNLDPAANPPTVVADPFHSSSSRDGWIAKAADGISPSPKLLNSWRSILGDSDGDTYLDQVDSCPLIANADCPRTPVGGTVAATFALTLGPAPTFGAFTPGVARTYETTATANVVTTAADAALSVSDPGHLTNGSFGLPEPLQVSLSKSAWSGPASNDPVTISFKQAIKATDALRSGAYSRTLTFTLSTTTP